MWTCGCLTCTSVPIEVPSRALCVDGLYGDVVRGVGDQILQSGVVSVSWNHSLRNRNTTESEVSRHQGVSDVIQKREEKMVCRSLVCLGVPCHLLLLIGMGLGCYIHCFRASVDSWLTELTWTLYLAIKAKRFLSSLPSIVVFWFSYESCLPYFNKLFLFHIKYHAWSGYLSHFLFQFDTSHSKISLTSHLSEWLFMSRVRFLFLPTFKQIHTSNVSDIRITSLFFAIYGK